MLIIARRALLFISWRPGWRACGRREGRRPDKQANGSKATIWWTHGLDEKNVECTKRPPDRTGTQISGQVAGGGHRSGGHGRAAAGRRRLGRRWPYVSISAEYDSCYMTITAWHFDVPGDRAYCPQITNVLLCDSRQAVLKAFIYIYIYICNYICTYKCTST